jgi:hypothetical protein
MMKRIKKPFTLLELLISLTILSLIGGMFAVKGKSLMDNYAFKQEVGKVRDILQLAREYACCYQADVQVIFSKTYKDVLVEIISDEPLLKAEKFFKKKYKFKKILSIDAGCDSIIFSGSGWVFPKNQVVISDCKQKVILEL